MIGRILVTAVLAASVAAAAPQTGQNPSSAGRTNAGELDASRFLGQVLTPGSGGSMWSSLSTAQKRESLAALASARAQATSESLGGPQQTNAGGLAVHRFTGHVLTDPDPALDGAPPRFLYAPSEADDPAFRAALSAAGGGAIVDYFDATAGTPTVSLMLTYDCVYTWANFAYSNNVLMGDNLAAYNDAGGDVVLGVFCTYTTGNFLAGMIMTAAYNPVVSPTGTNRFTLDSYQGDGTTCLYAGAGVPTCTFRDFLVTQGTGVIDGTYFDGEVCHAYRGTNPSGAGTVTYSNGGDGAPLGCTGFTQVIANACLCDPTGGGTPGSCTFRTGILGTNPNDYSCVNNPRVGQVWQSSIVTTPLLGTSTFATFVAIGIGGPVVGIPLFGFELLVMPSFIVDQSFGGHSIAIPPNPSFVGTALFTQGARLETAGPAFFVIMLNAQDLVVGS